MGIKSREVSDEFGKAGKKSSERVHLQSQTGAAGV
jgi:hypothetical protein